MARTKNNNTVVKKPQIVKSIDYNGGQIHRMDNGDIYAQFGAGGMVKAEGRGDAMKIIDEENEAVAAYNSTEATPTRGRRTKGVPAAKLIAIDVNEFPRGGHTPNPVEWCPHKRTFNNGKTFWAENVVCAFSCKLNADCPTYREFLTGRKVRIQRMDYKTAPLKCSYCEAEIRDKGDDIVTYTCETTFDKKTGVFERQCGKKATRTTRRTK